MQDSFVHIAILGIGTVGSAVYRHFLEHQELIFRKTGIRLNVKKILEKEPEKFFGQVPDKNVLTNDFDSILNDKSIPIVVELMGGTDAARQYVLSALKKGKHVVTANKALIAENGLELQEAITSSGSSFYYEGAVAGGIPILAVLKECFAANEIHSIQGIVNGTCNYILTEMAEKNQDFQIALKTAIKKGFAEADPAFDIEGTDSAHKLMILASLAFGEIVLPGSFPVKGITSLSILDIRMAGEMGYTIRLIASAEKMSDGLVTNVGPCLVQKKHPLSSVSGVYNAVFVKGHPIGKTMFYGRGAGGDPTSSAVLGDVIACAKNCVLGNVKHNLYSEHMTQKAVFSHTGKASCYYIRLWAEDKPGVLAKIAGIFGKRSISIASVLQKSPLLDESAEPKKKSRVPVFLTTHQAHESNILQAVEEIKNETEMRDDPVVMRILE
ncbi:MAG: homoserine dehydrogenase [Candidatus Aureabacteria bacterium]|nr:homoserine dehydrogenase [Candidatus Auribacterota bacterium]